MRFGVVFTLKREILYMCIYLLERFKLVVVCFGFLFRNFSCERFRAQSERRRALDIMWNRSIG